MPRLHAGTAPTPAPARLLLLPRPAARSRHHSHHSLSSSHRPRPSERARTLHTHGGRRRSCLTDQVSGREGQGAPERCAADVLTAAAAAKCRCLLLRSTFHGNELYCETPRPLLPDAAGASIGGARSRQCRSESAQADEPASAIWLRQLCVCRLALAKTSPMWACPYLL